MTLGEMESLLNPHLDDESNYDDDNLVVPCMYRIMKIVCDDTCSYLVA